MIRLRDDEPEYAFLTDKDSATVNTWENPIDLIARSGGKAPVNREMFINDEPGVGNNPNRNKQHAFHFTADNCIGCHACEAACSEKNDNPAHLSFRSVGYVEGGTYPDYQRMNISMACNHCDDPVCLKGCPTRAYTKHAEYGAVLQDPETCFGCGYCTWVCPYNAPQLDPIKGQVSKCNMCVDRLEVGLKPSCVAACLGNALNFGVVENTPERREEAKINIPGFPDPSISKPNIRFQQKKPMPEQMSRPDGMPVKYHAAETGEYRPVVDQKKGVERAWNFSELSSRENPLVMFTLSVQAGLGLMFITVLGQLLGFGPLAALAASPLFAPLLATSTALAGIGMLLSATHLGKPLRAYRGFNNLRHSPVAREGLGVLIFMVFAGLSFLAALPQNEWATHWIEPLSSLSAFAAPLVLPFAALALTAGGIGFYYMVKCYRIPARPFWNHWQTGTAFSGSALTLGSVLLAGFVVAANLGSSLSTAATQPLLALCATLVLAGVVLEAAGLWAHAKAMNQANNEGGASHYLQSTRYGKTYALRNSLLAVNAGLAVLAALGVYWALLPLAVGVIATSVIGRCLFYILVVPTTMPGAFFWKNKDFEQHARDIGLANMPQVGVVPNAH